MSAENSFRTSGHGVPAGTRLNGIYEIDRMISVGGVSEVYEGHEIQTGSIVAIKMLRPEMAEDDAALGQFRREAAALHYLMHEAIARYFVFTVEPTLQRPYLAMELVDGRSLAEMLLEDGPLTFDALLLLMRRVASGLNAAHERGIIHRDVSPVNMIVPQGDVARAKIVDFGIAVSTQPGDAAITGTGFAGKNSYVSPEQIGLFGGEVTARSDVYSFGLVLFYALTGQQLDTCGTQFQLVERRRRVPDLGAVDARIRPLIKKMLQPNPKDRPTMAEIELWSVDTDIPDQSPAPVRVEERHGQIAKASDRDSPLSASERDFKAWRDPVVDHIGELTASDFAQGTNHSRLRDRLVRLGRLLPGAIDEVKERQFRVGYEIERFEGLMAAYRSGGDDMPVLNAAQFEDLDRLRVALSFGIDKLERWAAFRKQAHQSAAGEAEADRAVVSDALDDMAATMEQRPRYFDPALPATFRFLAEAVRDPSGATRTVLYGAIKSAENVVSFLAQKALGIGRKGADAAETHISKAVATLLVAGLSSAALEISGALPHGWAWLKPLLAALGVGG